MKRSLSLLLAICMIMSLLPVTAMAAASTALPYCIEEVTLTDPNTHDSYTQLPQAKFVLGAEISGPTSGEPILVLLAQYNADGQMLAVEQLTGTLPSEDGLGYYEHTVDNTEGRVADLQLFVLSADADRRPLAEPWHMEPQEIPAGTIEGISLQVVDYWENICNPVVAVRLEEDCMLQLEIVDEESGDIWLESMNVDADEREVVFEVESLPGYFILTATLYTLDGQQIGDPYLCLDYSFAYEAFREYDEWYYEPERLIDLGEEDDGNLIALDEEVIRISQRPIRQENGTYTFAPTSDIQSLARPGAKICFLDQNGVYTTIRIGSSSRNGDAIVITPDSSAGIADLYDAIKIDMDIMARPSAENGAAVYRFAARGDEQGIFSSVEMGPAISTDVETSFGSVAAQLRAGGHVTVHYDPETLGSDYLRVDMLTKVSVEADLEVGPGIDVEEEIYLFPEVSLAGLEIIGHIPLKLLGTFDVECDAGMNMHLAAEVSAGYSFNTRTGTQKYEEKSITPSNVSAEGDIKIETGVRFSVGVDLLNDLLFTSIGVGAGLGLDAGIEAVTTPSFNTPEYHACEICMSGRSYAFANADLNMHYKVSERIEGDLVNLELIRAEWTIGRLYLSILNETRSVHKGQMAFGWGDCPNKKYLVNFVTYNNDTQESGHAVSVFDHNGKAIAGGPSTLKSYLYPDSYRAEAAVGTAEVETDFVVQDAMTVYLYAKDVQISGTVTDAETGEPLSGVNVMVLKADEVFRTTSTDGDGNYSILLPGGSYKVSFGKDGYESKVNTLSKLQHDQVVNGALEHIKNPGILTGTVTDKDTGKPIADGSILLKMDGGDPIYVRTDANGSFEQQLKAGSYGMTVNAPDYVVYTGSVVIEWEETTTVSVQMEKNKAELTVTVMDKNTHEVIEGAEISAYEGNLCIARGTTAADGTCTIKLPKGEHSIRVFKQGYARTITDVAMTDRDAAVTVQLGAAFASGYCGMDGDKQSVAWELSEDGVMTIFGSGPMDDDWNYGGGAGKSAPWDAYNERILKVVVEEGVTSVGMKAFYTCHNLTSVSLPQSLTEIGSYAFQECSKLTEIYLPAISDLGAGVFEQAELERVWLDPNSTLENIHIKTFKYCPIKELYLPASVKHIYYEGFYLSRLQDLQQLYYGGTEEQWKQITIEVNLDPHYTNVIETYPLFGFFTDPSYRISAEVHYNWTGDLHEDQPIN